MFLTIFTQTLKDHLKGIITFGVIMFLWMLYISAVFPSLTSVDLNGLMNSPIYQAIYGAGINMSTFEGYMSSKGMMMFALMFGGYIAWLSATFLSREVEHKTIDLLLSLPIKREYLVLARYLAFVPAIIVMIVAALAGIYAAIRLVHIDTSIQWFAWAMLYVGLFGLAFGAVSLFISALLSNGKQAALISIVLMLAMFFIETIGSVVQGVDLIRYVSLFHYVSYVDILGAHHVLSLVNAVVLIVVAVVFLAATVIVYRYREIQVA